LEDAEGCVHRAINHQNVLHWAAMPK
jgi:hypothetical protein